MNILVDTSEKKIRIGAEEFPCAIGKNGVVPQENGREGDGKTPLGTYQIRYGLFRDDRVALPANKLVFWRIQRADGWCDDPTDTAYNRPIGLPSSKSAEALWRDSHVYDIVIVLGHNDNPPAADKGSAVFLHIAQEGFAPTLGCVAIAKDDMLSLLPLLSKNSKITIDA